MRRSAYAQGQKTWFGSLSAKEKHEKDLEEMARKEVSLASPSSLACSWMPDDELDACMSA